MSTACTLGQASLKAIAALEDHPYRRPVRETATDVVVVGAGVIGLAVARACALEGVSVRIVEADGPVPASAAVASAGIIAARRNGASPRDRLMAHSARLHARDASAFLARGVDYGYRACGELELIEEDAIDRLRAGIDRLRSEGEQIGALLDGPKLATLEPHLAPATLGYELPDTAIVDAPAYVAALKQSCADLGVLFTTGEPATAILFAGAAAYGGKRATSALPFSAALDGLPAGEAATAGHPIAVATAIREYPAQTIVLCAGARTPALLPSLDPALEIEPLRGQAVVLRAKTELISRVITRGDHYLVPRSGGRVYVGATQELAGFDRRTTASAIAHLLAFAASVVPALANAEVEALLVGLRPKTPHARPIIEALSANLIVAAGHGRQGVTLAPATAEVVSAMVLGREPPFATEPFRR